MYVFRPQLRQRAPMSFGGTRVSRHSSALRPAPPITNSTLRPQHNALGIPQPTQGSNAGEVWAASTEFKFVPATVRVIAGRSVTLVLDNSQAETEHGIKMPAFGFYLIAKGGQVTRKTFIFDKPGEYEFMCDLPGHQE
jgi:plastocyanin